MNFVPDQNEVFPREKWLRDSFQTPSPLLINQVEQDDEDAIDHDARPISIVINHSADEFVITKHINTNDLQCIFILIIFLFDQMNSSYVRWNE